MTEAATKPQMPTTPPAKDPPRVSAEAAGAYIERRIKPQATWFNKRAADAKRWHYSLTGAQLIATSSIPVLNVFFHSVVASTILAFVATIAAGFGQLWKHHEHWLRYRATASELDALQIRYELRLPPFDDEDAHAKVIEEADRLLGQEGAKWTNAIRHADKGAASKASVSDHDDC